ncbi:hypothetical protein BGZ51_008162 [Haplosporangium sp. Z 767]|nr:hypothetical protein BGZ51_008162 [Haplosporangium sp. Z 767]
MSRPTDHHRPEEYHLPMYHTNTKDYHQHHYSYDSPSMAPQGSYSVNANTDITATTNSSNSGSRLITIKPASCLSASSSTSYSSGSSSSKKKRLQVSWHPSVNQRHAAKRDRQIAYLLGVLFFFSSLTMILFHYSECDIATGQCQQQQQRRSNRKLDISSASAMKSFESSFPALHGRKRLPSVTSADMLRAKGLLMDADVMVSVNGRFKSSSTDSARTSRNPHDLDEYNMELDEAFDDEADSATEDLSMDHITMNSEPSQDEGMEGTTGYAAVGYGLDDDISLEEAEPSNKDGNGNDEHEHITPMNDPNATPQEAYVDIWNDTPDTLSKQAYLELEQPQHQLQQSLLRRLDPSTKYMTYLPYAGLTSQFYGMLRAFMLAKSLDRTLILPPITISSHDSDMDSAGGSSSGSGSGPSRQNQQPWSTYFDLGTFMDLTGVKVIELHELREPDMMIMGATAEPLSCHVTCGVGSLRPLDFTAKEFLEQWKFDLSIRSPQQLEDETTEYGELAPALRAYDSEQMLCITNSFKVSVPMKEDWELYGQYLYFTPTMERFFGGVLQKLGAENPQKQQQQNEGKEEGEQYTQDDEDSQSTTTTTNTIHENNRDFMNSALTPNRDLYAFQKNNGPSNEPPRTVDNALDNAMTATTSTPLLATPFIAIHARRGAEYIDYCQQNFQHALHTCLPTTQELASALHTLLLANPSLRGLPVYVCTDEDRPRELAAFRLLGWQVLNHEELRSKERLGVFGAKMMEQMVMAQAEVLIGVRTSTFSRVSSYRQEDWYGRKVVFM